MKGDAQELDTYWLTRNLFIRCYGIMYLIGFWVILNQWLPLVGKDGLYPVGLYLTKIQTYYGAGFSSWWQVPSLFWFSSADTFMQITAWIGLVLSLLVIGGIINGFLMAALWIIYMSFVHTGQLFYGYGWEMMLLEGGFLGIFFCPFWRKKIAPDKIIIWFYRWFIFRVMFGAGMIKIRGDACWTDLTCLLYHYETQPIPNPISWYMHNLPPLINKVGVFFTHFIELVVPWMFFGPRRVRHLAGVLAIIFQLVLIMSGNLSFLNWLTLILCIPCLDDSFFKKFITPQSIKIESPHFFRKIIIGTVSVLILTLSIRPAMNLLSSRQYMNYSWDPFNIVGTYGAFGSVGKKRTEVIIQGTSDRKISKDTVWKEYEIKCKPGDPKTAPCWMSPYHFRITWQIWFAAMQDYQKNPWLIHLVHKLLKNDPGAVSFLSHNPFADKPPLFIRAEHYLYEFTDWHERGQGWWKRQRIGSYLPPLSLDNPSLKKFMIDQKWLP